jgi:L-amino acid N-acyltransferase YncA
VSFEAAVGTVPGRGLSLKPVRVRELVPSDWPAVARIYAEGIATGNATFETGVPSWPEWDRGHLADHRFVAVDNAEVVGWIALAPVSGRCCYAGVAEISAYVAEAARGRGVGKTLLEQLVAGTEAAGIWTLETGVFPENEASLALLKRCGFREIGLRERIGKLDGVWRDVVFLERRSEVIE